MNKTARGLIAASMALSLMVFDVSAPSISPVAADGAPDVALTVAAPAEVLYGAPIPVSLSATQTSGPDGYNLSFTNTLPDGATLTSATPAPSDTITLGTGETVLIWLNVADLLTGAAAGVTYEYTVDETIFDIGDIVTTSAGAYVSDNPRDVPDFDPVTGAATGDFQGWGVGAAATTLLPFELEKNEPNAESELLRGVHDHKTVFTLTVTNNLLEDSTGFAIVDYLPAGVEFLGCAAQDNSTALTHEYAETAPGVPAGANRRIDATAHPAFANACPTPSSVTTVTTDPDGGGPLPVGVHTRVEWDAAALVSVLGAGSGLLATESFSIDYAAAIALHANVAAALANPTANLDNNTGALTADEQSWTNWAQVSGTTDGTGYLDDDTEIVIAEDVSIHKTVDTPSFVHGVDATWTLVVESSEYAQATTSITVTDTIPDGLTYQSSSVALSSGPTNNPSGTQTVEWTLPPFAAPNSSATITLVTDTLADYRAGGPVSANDGWTNDVDLATTATLITSPTGSTTSGVGIVDESAASQGALGLSILKEVSEPAAGTLTCGDGTGVAFDSVVAGDYRPGDRVCWRLTVNFPNQLDTLSPYVKDFLPVGFVYESEVFGAGHDLGTGVTFDGSGSVDGVLIWDLDDADPNGETFEVVVSSIRSGPEVVQDGDITANLMKFSYLNTDGSLFQLRDQADATFVAPVLSATKTPSVSTARGGDSVIYTVEFDNAGGLGADNATVVDTLPTGITCSDITALGGAVCSDAGPNSTLTWTGVVVPAAVGAVPGSATLAYTLLLPAIFNPAASLDNNVAMTRYETPTNNGAGFVVTLGGPTADATITISDAILSKTRTTGVNEQNNGVGQATIGETINYDIRVTIPDGTTIDGAVLSDAMPSGVRLDTATATLNGLTLPGTFGFVSSASGFTLTLPDPYTNSSGSGNDEIRVVVASTVTNVVGNNAGDSRTNGASFTWPDGPKSASVGTSVVEPAMAVAKSSNDVDGQVNPGQFVEYTVNVTNSGSVAHDVTIVDTLPIDVVPRTGPGGGASDVVDGGTVASGGVWDLGARTITWTLTSVSAVAVPGDVLVYDTRVNNPLIDGTKLRNDVSITTASSMAGTPADERDAVSAAGFGLPGYDADAFVELNVPAITVNKSASPSAATVGDTVTYTLEVALPADITGYDASILDTMPAGMIFDELLAPVVCSEPGANPCTPARTATAISSPGDTGTIGFFIGDFPAASVEPQLLTLTYTAYPDDDAVNVDTALTLTNSALVGTNETDNIAGTPPTVPLATDFDTLSAPDTASVAVVEPLLTVDKVVGSPSGGVASRRAKPGEVLTFELTIENDGDAPAYDIVVADTPDARLTAFTSSSTPALSAVNTDGDPSDGTLEWTIAGPIAPLGAVTITYDLTVPNTLDETAEVVAGYEVSNTADVTEYHGVPVATRTLPANSGRDYRQYGSGAWDVTPDTVNVELDLASIGNRVWHDVDGDGVQDGGEPGLNNVDVTVTFAGDNDTFGDLDDEAVTVTTSGNGDWSVNELPGGMYRVDVDTDDLPPGFTASWDLDDELTAPDGDWEGTLAEDGAVADVDAGFTGTGSIGNVVWFDQDLSGAQNGDEPGIGALGVTLVWAGPNEILGDGDDVSYADSTATTGTIGAYLFAKLPAGAYSLTVDGLDLPPGFAFVSDPDAGAADGAAVLSLGAAQNKLDQDFGLSGAGSIGEFVYLDRDGSGAQAGVGEPGLEGVTMTLTYGGADGLLDTADDITFTDVTGSNGEFVFENLPPNEYRVTVTGPLPTGAANTGDPDGGIAGESELTLADGEDNTAQNFGYDVDSSIGNRVWWDVNNDGVQDAGEPGMNGVTVTATYFGADGVAGGGDDLVFTDVTSGNGLWLVDEIPDGEYLVAVTAGVPAGVTVTYDQDSGTASPDGSSALTLATLDLGQDFGYSGDSSIGDTVWLDRDGDGTQNGDESGVPAVSVTVTWAGPDDNVGTTGDNVEFTRVTDNTGGYLFPGLPAGTYEIAVDEGTLPNGAVVTADPVNGTSSPSSTVTLSLPAATDLDTVDFGYQGDSAIGDTVYWDRNNDGDHDVPGDNSDEPGIGGVTVDLVWAGPDGSLTLAADNAAYSTTTDNDGGYAFTGLPGGLYRVDIDISTLPTAMTNTDDEDGDDNSSTTVALAVTDDHDTADFGYAGAASIGDTIYLDLDGDRVQGGAEPGVPAQTVTLRFEGADGVLGTVDDIVLTTVTDGNGEYRFDNAPDGDFRVAVVGGITGHALNNADPDDGTGDQADLTITSGADDLGQDFGYEGDNGLGDTIWWDVNADGVINSIAVEPRLAGVDVRVTFAGPNDTFGDADDIVVSTEQTDSGGSYSRAALPDGNYRIEVTAGVPAGMDNTYDADDLTAAPNSTSDLSLTGATTDNDQDFGFAGTGAIGDVVYFDRDGSGGRGAPDDEPGIEGVDVTLTFAGADSTLGTSDDITIVQQTGAAGDYGFGGLPAGDYTVAVTAGLPVGAVNSDDPDIAGAPDIGDSSATVALAGGEDNDTQDFGYDVVASLGDRVWWDFNRDGAQDPNEPGLSGITVTVTFFGGDGVVGGIGDLVFTRVTDSDGLWLVRDVPEGNYSVRIDGLPTGFSHTYDDDDGTASPDGESLLAAHTGVNVAQDFGVAGTSSIGDTVWLDRDGDGIIDPPTSDAGEVGLAGVDVTLTWAGPNGTLGDGDDVDITVTTDAAGDYGFDGLPAGEYEITVATATMPPGLTPSYDRDGPVAVPDGSAELTLASATHIDDVDFGYIGLGSIGDLVFFDRDRNGAQTVGGDADEPGLENVSAELTWEGEDGILGTGDDETFATTTDASGAYLFDGLPSGDFVVEVITATLPPAMGNTVDEDGDANSSTPVTLAADDHDTADFGYAGTASIGDVVYVDLDGDGSQSADEPGVPGQAVTLSWEGEDGITGTSDDESFSMTTDEDGGYSFDNLPDGAYVVSVVGGVADHAVNTADPDGLTADESSLVIGGGVSDPDQDFGYQGTGALGDTVFFDVDADGVDDGAGAEPRLDDVDVLVIWLGPDGLSGGGDDVVIPVTATDAAGTYGVTGLPSGAYAVTPDAADLLPGLVPSTDPDDVAAAPDGTAIVTLAAAETNLEQDFGFAGGGSIGDLVWLDHDGDGTRQPAELGFEGATVTLTWLGADGVAGGGDDLVSVTTVADDGAYRFDHLPAGEFTIVVSGLPDGLDQTADPDGGADSTATVHLDPGESDIDQDFGYRGTAGVGNTVWLEVDGDGAQRAGEPGLSGISVTVASAGVDGLIGTSDDLIVVTTTGPGGQYAVTGLPAGPTSVTIGSESLPPGTAVTADPDGDDLATSTVVLVGGETDNNQDFGVSGNGSLAGTAFNDTDGDGLPGSGHPGLPNVTVTVTLNGPDGPIIITTTTDADGAFEVNGLPPGDYVVEILPEDFPPGFIPNGPTSLDATIGPAGAASPPSLDFPFVMPGSIGQLIWIDSNRNGVQDAGEAGAPGVTVELLDANGNVVATAVTGSAGEFLFADLTPGVYTVVIDPATYPAGVVLSSDPDGVIDTRYTVSVGPGEHIRTALFGLSAALLPRAGIDSMNILLLAMLFMALGVALLGARRRREDEQATLVCPWSAPAAAPWSAPCVDNR